MRRGPRIEGARPLAFCAHCRRSFNSHVGLTCPACLAKTEAAERGRNAIAKHANTAASAERLAIHKGIFFDCRVTLRISSSGVTAHWLPHPSRLPRWVQEDLQTQFASWRNRFVRQFAHEHGLSVRPIAGQPDLLEPCEARR